MRFATRFLLFASLVAAASHAVSGLSIAARSDVEVITRDVKVDFSTDVMPPHDVELVRRAGWTYNNSTLLLCYEAI